jgi:hypothetical protein
LFNFNDGSIVTKYTKGLAHKVVTFGVAQFIILTMAAAILYPGEYDLFSHHLSELGASVARNGAPNAASSTLYSVALISMALALIPFWFEALTLFGDTNRMKTASRLGSALGLMSSPFLVGVALYPFDTQLDMHFKMFLAFFPLFNLASLIYSTAIIVDQGLPNRNGFLGFSLLALSIIVLVDPMASYVSFLQKILLYGYFIWVLFMNKLIYCRRVAAIQFSRNISARVG